MRRDRGYSLIELTVAVGLIALFAATGAGLTLANRSLAVAAAASEFDQLLDSARTMARQLGGGRISFTADGDGTIGTFSTTDADGTLAPTTLPALHTRAHIAEQDSLGDPAFALVLHADGRLGGIPNAGATTATELGCPASGRYHIRISAAGGSADRFLPCRTVLATGGPLTYTVWPPATIAPTPVAQCAGPCTPPPLPVASMVAVACPPGTNSVGDTCVPVAALTPTPASTATPTAVATATPTVVPPPVPTPTASSTPVATCDLVQSGTCFRRIAGPTLEMFDKTVSPGYTCDSSSATCQWVNEVGLVTIAARESYSVQPPLAPSDMAHRLLYIVDGVAGIYKQCSTFGNIRDYYPEAPNAINWSSFTNSSNAGNLTNINLPPGFGEPDTYAFRNEIVQSAFPISGIYAQYDHDHTQYSNTIDQFYSAVDAPSYGHAVATQYFNSAIALGQYVTYIPDFTDCASGYPEDRIVTDQLYGITIAAIVMETYQAVAQ